MWRRYSQGAILIQAGQLYLKGHYEMKTSIVLLILVALLITSNTIKLNWSPDLSLILPSLKCTTTCIKTQMKSCIQLTLQRSYHTSEGLTSLTPMHYSISFLGWFKQDISSPSSTKGDHSPFIWTMFPISCLRSRLVTSLEGYVPISKR